MGAGLAQCSASLGQAHPVLFFNIRELHCCSLAFSTQRDMLFSNFKMSGRGSIRKPPNMIDWVHSLKQLAVRGGERDTGSIIKTWNSQCTQNLQIVGRKAMSLKNLLELMPPDGLAVVSSTTSTYGWEDGPYTEDCLATKRIFPGYIFRADGKEWTQRQTVTKDSCIWMLRRIDREMAKQNLRGKLTEKMMGERAQMAAVAVNVSKELRRTAPVSDDAVQAWLLRWAEGDASLDMEIKSAMLSHDTKFQPKDLPSLSQILQEQSLSVAGNTQVLVCNERVRMHATELEESTWQLVQKQITYDKEAFQCYMAKRGNVERAVYHKRMEWKVQCHRASQAAAESWMDKNCTLTNAESEELSVAYKQLVDQLTKRHSVLGERVVPVVVVNWSAPCMLGTSTFRAQADFLKHLLCTSRHTVAVLVMPQFAYKQSELHLTEQMVVQTLLDRKITINKKWGLSFEARLDLRDNRPLLYDGKLLLSEGEKDKDYLWASSKIMRGRTEYARQLPSKSMQMVEDVTSDALPTTTSMDEVLVKGAAKFSQLGEDAMTKILDGILEGPDWGRHQGNICLVLVELNAGVGHLLDAYVTRKAAVRMPLHYMGVVDNAVHQEWLKHSKLTTLSDKHAAGELLVGGHPTPPKDMPTDLLETNPLPPKLNKLAIVEETSGPKLVVPKELSDTWGNNDKFQHEFKAICDNLVADVGASLGTQTTDSAGGTPNKKRGVADLDPTPLKRPRVGEDKFVDEAGMVAGDDLFRTNLVGSKDLMNVFLVIKPNHRIYLLNTGKKDVELAEGWLVAGFGKGKFKYQEKEPDANPDTHILHHLANWETKVYYNGGLRTLLDLVEERRQTVPEPKICYHTMDDIADGPPGAFRLTLSTEVLFAMLDQEVTKDGKELLINKVAALIPTAYWRTHCTDVFWAMKWTTGGLQPTRPVVCLTAAVTLPPGKALAFN